VLNSWQIKRHNNRLKPIPRSKKGQMLYLPALVVVQREKTVTQIQRRKRGRRKGRKRGRKKRKK